MDHLLFMIRDEKYSCHMRNRFLIVKLTSVISAPEEVLPQVLIVLVNTVCRAISPSASPPSI